MADKLHLIEPRGQTFLSFLSIFVFNRKWVGLSFLIAALGGFAFYSFYPRYYQADVTLISMMKPQFDLLSGDRQSGEMSLVSNLLAASQSSQSNQLLVTLLRSNPVLDFATTNSGLIDKWHLKKVGHARGRIAKRIKSKEEKGGIILVSYQNEDPQIAQDVAEHIVGGLNETLNRLNSNEMERTLKFLDARLGIVEKEMQRTVSERDYRLKEAVYLMLLREYEVARIKAARERLAVDMLSPVEVSEGPVTPRLDLTILVTIAAGILLSFFMVTFAEYVKNVKANPQDQELLNRMKSSFRNKAS